MTVIVMIFLMALVVILIRNVDLVRQLKQTIALEQESAVQSDTLALRIATLGDEIAGLQLQLGETDARRLQAESTAVERQQKIGALLSNIAALEKVRERLVSENAGLVSSQDALQGELLSMEEQQQVLENLEQELKIEVAALALQRDTLAEEQTSLTEDNASLRQQLEHSAVERQQLADTVATIGAEREQYRTESAVLGEKNLTLEQQLSDLVSLKTLLEQRVESLDDEKIALQGERTALTEKNAGLERKVSALTKFQVQLESQVNNLASALAKLEEDKTRLSEENRSTTAWLATLLELKQSLESDQATLKEKLAKAETDRTELQASRLALEREVTVLVEHRLTLEQEQVALVDQTTIRETEMLEQARNLRAEINILVLAKNRLAEEKSNLDRQLHALAQQQVTTAQTQQKLEEDLAGSQERYRLTKTELDYLVAKHADEIMAFENEKALLVENLQAFELLKGQYGDLEVAYNRLVRPARNMVGRYVVRVRYWKESGRFHYSLQEPDQVVETEVSEDELHEHLSELKDAHPGNLFTHVLFPGGKDISHEEAYLFERTIVSRYDYYESD
jgi:myosin heavy subunit